MGQLSSFLNCKRILSVYSLIDVCVGAAGMGKGALTQLPPPPSGNVVKCLCISSYSKTLSRRNIYALFSQTVVGFWGFRPQTSHPGSTP